MTSVHRFPFAFSDTTFFGYFICVHPQVKSSAGRGRYLLVIVCEGRDGNFNWLYSAWRYETRSSELIGGYDITRTRGILELYEKNSPIIHDISQQLVIRQGLVRRGAPSPLL